MDRNVMLGSTAYWTASVRAQESRRQDRLFEDPWAESLAGQIGADWVLPQSTVGDWSSTPSCKSTYSRFGANQNRGSQIGLRPIVN
jgi:O-methyltransferase involved in polyketide biosynthesis